MGIIILLHKVIVKIKIVNPWREISMMMHIDMLSKHYMF